MDFKEGFKEVGKAIINVGVGTVLFAIVQPFVKGEFSTTLGITAFFTFILFLLIGSFLISAGVIKMTIEEYLVFLMVGISSSLQVC